MVLLALAFRMIMRYLEQLARCCLCLLPNSTTQMITKRPYKQRYMSQNHERRAYHNYIVITKYFKYVYVLSSKWFIEYFFCIFFLYFKLTLINTLISTLINRICDNKAICCVPFSFDSEFIVSHR